LIWTPRALLDIQRLYRFLASRNPDAARRAVKAIRAGVGLLAKQPRMGRPADDPPQSRDWNIDFGHGGYVARYHYDEAADLVTVLAVRHQKESGFWGQTE
jgi:plasmid stabilization system protein ParE